MKIMLDQTQIYRAEYEKTNPRPSWCENCAWMESFSPIHGKPMGPPLCQPCKTSWFNHTEGLYKYLEKRYGIER